MNIFIFLESISNEEMSEVIWQAKCENIGPFVMLQESNIVEY